MFADSPCHTEGFPAGGTLVRFVPPMHVRVLLGVSRMLRFELARELNCVRTWKFACRVQVRLGVYGGLLRGVERLYAGIGGAVRAW